MLTNVISSFAPKNVAVLKLISWKHTFKRLSEEYEMAKKKKQALDNLFETGRISQSTRDSFNNDIVAAIAEIERQQKDLLAKMELKIHDLESQIKMLETLLANYEIQHVVGEIDEEIYQHEIAILSTGLDTTKRELAMILEATNQLCLSPAPVAEPSLPEENAAVPTVEAPSIETVPIAPAEVEVAAQPCPQEPAMPIEEAAPALEPEAVTTEEAAPVEEAPAEAEPVETAPAEIVTEDALVEDAPVEAAPIEEAPIEAESVEIAPAESTEVESVEVAEAAETTDEATEATDEAPQEPLITIEEAEPEQPYAEIMEEAPAETAETEEIAVEIPEEPVITIEDSVIEQPSEESDEILIEEVPQLVEDIPPAVEEVALAANPRVAPQEAHQELLDEAIAEQDEDAVEEAADSSEDQE